VPAFSSRHELIKVMLPIIALRNRNGSTPIWEKIDYSSWGKKQGELENTIIVVTTADNGMPFPSRPRLI